MPANFKDTVKNTILIVPNFHCLEMSSLPKTVKKRMICAMVIASKECPNYSSTAQLHIAFTLWSMLFGSVIALSMARAVSANIEIAKNAEIFADSAIIVMHLQKC
jgi:hypothetical protein